MILLIDIGNTTIVYGLSCCNKIYKKDKILTADFLSEKTSAINKFKQLKRREISAIVICSVVPKVTNKLTVLLKKIFSIKPLIIGKDIIVPMKNLYREKKQVGQDRLVASYAAATFYGCPVIVADFGTAITFDAVSQKKEYLGGMILPGIDISLDALSRRTALLPRVRLNKKPRLIIGKDTQASILSGICFGFGSLCDGLIQRLQVQIGKCKVIATGGQARIIKNFCRSIDKIDDDLILKGLVYIYTKIKKPALQKFQ